MKPKLSLTKIGAEETIECHHDALNLQFWHSSGLKRNDTLATLMQYNIRIMWQHKKPFLRAIRQEFDLYLICLHLIRKLCTTFKFFYEQPFMWCCGMSIYHPPLVCKTVCRGVNFKAIMRPM